MATSQNGYAAFSAYGDSHLRSFPWVSGAVNKVAYEIFDLFCADYNATVEKIDKKSSWGFAPRTIRGASTQLSNHASGTALDLNAPKHPLGKVGTFNAAQRTAISRLQAKYPELRWGGSYAGRKDEMHWEVNASPAALAARVQKLKGGTGSVTPAGTVKPSKPAASAPKQPDDYKDLYVDGKFGAATVKAVQIVMRAIGKYRRAVDGDWGTHTKTAVQNWLKGLGYYKRAVDGSFGKNSVTALQTFLRAKGLYPASKYVIDGDFGPATIKALQQYLNTQNGK